MNIVDRGTGAPVVLIPGIQGHWEWMRPTVDALAARCRVITFSLADEPRSGWPATRGDADLFARYVAQVGQALDARGLQAATICGISFGGLIAAAFARRHPERVHALVLVSAIPPSWRPDTRERAFLRFPRLLFPAFLIGSVRLYREIAVATPGRLRGLLVAVRSAARALWYFPSATRMARRANAVAGADFTGVAHVRVPTLLITGEPQLERVVPPALTAEYARLWPNVRAVTLARTGHLGLVTRPEAFAGAIASFVAESEGEAGPAAATRRNVG